MSEEEEFVLRHRIDSKEILNDQDSEQDDVKETDEQDDVEETDDSITKNKESQILNQEEGSSLGYLTINKENLDDEDTRENDNEETENITTTSEETKPVKHEQECSLRHRTTTKEKEDGESAQNDLEKTVYETTNNKENQKLNEDNEYKEENTIQVAPHTYWLTRIVYLRAIAFIYFVAFLIAFNQNKQLIGDNGLLPLKIHMQDLKKSIGNSWLDKLYAAPTLLWFAEPWNDINIWLDLMAGLGLVLSSLVIFTGAANAFIILTMWVLYHSIIAVGQRWYGFGWESQLLETSLLALWGAPLLSLNPLPKKTPPSWVTVYGLRWLLFRIMLGAGLIKIRGDKCWKDLTCMNYHYETQPVPNPMSYYMHQGPAWWHMTETFGNHIIELVLPFLTFLPRIFRMTCGFGQIFFQVVLIISGNLSFLNWLTIVPSFAYFDDQFYQRFFTKSTKKKIKEIQLLETTNSEQVEEGMIRKIINYGAALLLAYLSLPVIINLLSSKQIMNTSYDPFRIVNTYGAFGSVTKVRTEVVFEGTHHWDPDDPKAVWAEYEFKCKPGRVDRAPCVISPYHYRLDWLMWFAAFQSYEKNPWLVHLAGKFLINDIDTSTLISYNPFLGTDPPRWIRARHFQYEYEPSGTHFSSKGNWYRRTLKGSYLPAVDIDMLEPVFDRMKWKTFKKYQKNKSPKS